MSDPEADRDRAPMRSVRGRGMVAHRPGSAGAATTRKPVERRFAGRLPVSGSDGARGRAAAQSPWACLSCGLENRYFVHRCRRCGEGRPW